MQNHICSICCLSYNHSKYIKYAVESFFNQTYKNIEIIALDDGSSDNSVEILQEMQKKSPVPFKVLTQSNSGNIGGNFNKLLDNASGEYIIFISLDDALMNDFIEEKIKIIDNDINCCFAATTSPYVINEHNEVIDTKPHLPIDKENKPITIDYLLNLEYETLGSFYIQGCIFRKSILNLIGGFDTDILGDDIVLRTKLFRLIKANTHYTFNITKKSSFFYRRHESNLHKNTKRQALLLAQYYKRFWDTYPVPYAMASHLSSYISKESSKENVLSFISSNDYFLKTILEYPRISQVYNDIFVSCNPLGYLYKKISFPFFEMKKYRNNHTNYRYKQINILGFKFIIKKKM